MKAAQRAVDGLLTVVEDELATAEAEREDLDRRIHLLEIERDGLRLAQRRFVDDEPGEEADVSGDPDGTEFVADEVDDGVPLNEMTRAAAITRILEEHGGCDLAELLALLRANGRDEEQHKGAVSVMLNTLKKRGVVENFSGEWRLVLADSSPEVGDTCVTPTSEPAETQAI